MILIEMFLICNLNAKCPEFNQQQFKQAEMFLERELQEDVEFKFHEKQIEIKQNLRFDSKSLTNYNYVLRRTHGTVDKVSNSPDHIYGFLVNGSAQYVGQADIYHSGNAFYVHGQHGNEKTIAHEILHLFGFAHNIDDNDIMRKGTPCVAKKNIMECTNTGENTFWEIKLPHKTIPKRLSETYPHHNHRH